MDRPIHRRLPADTNLLALHAAHPQRYPHLLTTTAASTSDAGYDILFAFPGEIIDGQSAFLTALANAFDLEQADAPGDVRFPFRGGWFLFLGYELLAEIEPSVALPQTTPNALPTAHACRFRHALIRDHRDDSVWAVGEPGTESQLEQIAADVADSNDAVMPASMPLAWQEDSPDDYLRMVERTKDYIREGDIFQANLSREWRAQMPIKASHASLFQALANNNPGPFAGLASWGERSVISSSPERLVRIIGQQVDTRPIAGTSPRSTDANADRRRLAAHPKEQAEHLMLIDLERNDLGRVCQPGTVDVDEMMAVESYAHVHHIVSNVRGQLRDGVGPADVIRAVFPGGTITGCPKVRCMQIIAELEQTPRGAYTGAMGYLNRNGDMDLNILIRTLVRDGNQLSVRAGAGIVADSDPHRELAETRAKARGVIEAFATS